MTLFLKHAAFTIAFIFIAICYIGPHFDEVCVEGKIGPEQVKALEGVPWGHCPSYRHGECRVNVDDRVIIMECSEASRSTFLWWKKLPKQWKKLKLRAFSAEE